MASATEIAWPSRAKKPRVAFQGERGAYGDDAIEAYWCERGGAHRVASWSFDDVVSAVRHGRAEYGILPIENTVVGPIAATHALLETVSDLCTAGEITVPVRHALVALPGARIANLSVVASHGVALRQCGRFLAQHPHLTLHESYDTAGAAREVAAHGRLDEAAIASPRAAAWYGLAVLAENVQDVLENQTRFIILTHAHSDRW